MVFPLLALFGKGAAAAGGTAAAGEAAGAGSGALAGETASTAAAGAGSGALAGETASTAAAGAGSGALAGETASTAAAEGASTAAAQQGFFGTLAEGAREGALNAIKSGNFDGIGESALTGAFSKGLQQMLPKLKNAKGFGQVANQFSGQSSTPENNLLNTQPQNTGFLQRAYSGFGDFQRGYNDNYNNAFNPNNYNQTQFTYTTPGNNNKLENYQAQLSASGKYSPEEIAAVAQGKNSGYKNIDNWIKANPDAFPTTQVYDKGFWGKVGEGVGTASRFINSPVGQAIVGGAYGMMSGNPMIALSNAYSMGTNRAKSDIYNQALKKYGINPGQGFFSNVSKDDLNALANADYMDRRMDYYDMWNRYREKELARKTAADKVKEQQGNEKIAIQRDKNRSNGKGGNGGGGKDDNNKKSGTDLKAVEELQKRGYQLINGKWIKK